MQAAKENDTVKIHFTGKLDDGTVVASTQGDAPLEFTLGSNTLIPGVEEAVAGMNEGEKKVESIDATRAFGPVRDDLIVELGPDAFPEGVSPSVGDRFEAKGAEGSTRSITVVEVKDDAVVVDANDPLAGKDLVFEIELVEIVG